MFSAFLQANPVLPLLASYDKRIAYPKASERDKWAGIEEDLKKQIKENAEALGKEDYPLLTADMFLAFSREGNRKIFETPYFLRRKKLIAAALYECLTMDGTQLNNVINGLWLICEESSWVVSAHNINGHTAVISPGKRPLPEIDNPIIDLFAAQTAATLALICHLLGDALDQVTPLVMRRVALEINKRIITPFFNRDDFWWMGTLTPHVNNWTPWVISNILPCLMVFEKDDLRLAEGVSRAMRILDFYVASMPEDGGCDEGASYWNMAGASLLDCLESIYVATAGKASFYKEKKIAAIGMFPYHAHIHGPYYWDFADCDAKPILDGERLYTYGCRIKNNGLRDLGAALAWEDRDFLPKDTPQFARMLDRLFTEVPHAEMPKCEDALLPDLQVWARLSGGMYAAIKGGHNAESHNHNDVGSFLIYNEGAPAVIDVGNMVYTAKTFGPDRYSLFNTRSRSHNLPLIGEYEQHQGFEYKAREVVFTDDAAQMEIKDCYPKEAGVETLVRRFEKAAAGFVLKDAITLSKAQPVTWVFMLREKPEVKKNGLHAGSIKIAFDETLRVGVEEIQVEDARMARNFPGCVYRVTFEATSALAHEAVFTFSAQQ